MDHNSESLQIIAPAADEIHVLQDSQDSRFHRLQREHTLKWRRLNQEYEAKRAQIEARQHDEEQSFTSAFEQNLKTIQHALTWIQESVESTIAKRVNLELNKNSLRRVYEDEMTREESDLHEKIHGIIKSSRHKSNQTSTSPSLERAPTSPCTPVTSGDQQLSVLSAELHQMPLHRCDASPSGQTFPLDAGLRALTPQPSLPRITRPATTPQTSRPHAPMPRGAPSEVPMTVNNMQPNKLISIASALTEPLPLEVELRNENSKRSNSALPPHPQPISDTPMRNVPRQTSVSLMSPATPSRRQDGKRKSPESPPSTAITATKRRRGNNPGAAAQHASAAQHLPTQRQHASKRLGPTQEGATQQVISFEDVYQDGKAKHKHKIFEHKEGSGNWYIVRCDEHNIHFGFKNPVHGAAKHINSPQHGKLEKKHDLAIQTCGFLVKDCTARLAEKNNKAFEEALKTGYQVLKPTNKTRIKPFGVQSGSRKDGNGQNNRFSRQEQAKFRNTKPHGAAVQPESESELIDERCDDLNTGRYSTQEASDCIVVPSQSESEPDVDVGSVCGVEGDSEDINALDGPTPPDHDPSVSFSEQTRTKKQDADYRVVAAALVDHPYSGTEKVLGGPRGEFGNLALSAPDREGVGHDKEAPVNNYKRFDALQAQITSEAGSR
ncbi:hypothetical protein F5883DRAFT_240350 [Diaporthe sp. PMI_573]|nr:hypothetical protein F5883DRAFT_240350 [Diaporthaceae sp. PMI_573]